MDEGDAVLASFGQVKNIVRTWYSVKSSELAMPVGGGVLVAVVRSISAIVSPTGPKP